MSRTYTAEDITEMEEVIDELADVVKRVNRILHGDGWAEAYFVNHLDSLLEKTNRYDKDINDVIEHMRENQADEVAA